MAPLRAQELDEALDEVIGHCLEPLWVIREDLPQRLHLLLQVHDNASQGYGGLKQAFGGLRRLSANTSRSVSDAHAA